LLTFNRNVPDAFANAHAHLRIAFSPEAYLLTDAVYINNTFYYAV